MGSTPLIIISGQVRLQYTSSHNKLGLRTFGEQEIDIISMCQSICKYSKLVDDISQIQEIMETAYLEACRSTGAV